jgi:hypothetical protein
MSSRPAWATKQESASTHTHTNSLILNKLKIFKLILFCFWYDSGGGTQGLTYARQVSFSGTSLLFLAVTDLNSVSRTC